MDWRQSLREKWLTDSNLSQNLSENCLSKNWLPELELVLVWLTEFKREKAGLKSEFERNIVGLTLEFE